MSAELSSSLYIQQFETAINQNQNFGTYLEAWEILSRWKNDNYKDDETIITSYINALNSVLLTRIGTYTQIK